jgi:hypothetical protein
MAAIGEESRSFSSTASTLLQEYTKKLDTLRKDAEKLVSFVRNSDRTTDVALADRRLQTIDQTFLRLQGGLTKLARSTSQRLEHTDLDEATYLELMVRLADFEATLQRTQMSIRNVRAEIRD